MGNDKSPPAGQEDYAPEPEVFYAATYNHSTGRLDVNVLAEDDDPEAKPGTLNIRSNDGDTTLALDGVEDAMRYEPLEGDAWETFYKHATLEEILDSVAPDGGDSVSAMMDRFYSCAEGEEKTSLALRIIRDSFGMLGGEEFLLELIKTLEKARWSTDRDESVMAINLLKDHLLPVRPGGRIPLPPNIQAVKAILEALAKHFSERCRSVIPDGVSRGAVSEEYLDDLTEWASVNKEFRLSRLPREELNMLILKPMTYIKNLLEARFHSSIKTVRCNNDS